VADRQCGGNPPIRALAMPDIRAQVWPIVGPSTSSGPEGFLFGYLFHT